MNYQLRIDNGSGNILEPAVLDGITWQTERKNYPGTLSFSVVIDDALKISEGNWLTLMQEDKPVFSGYIFKRSRDKDNVYKITAYDQLRYFKNKDTYNYGDKRADELLKMLCSDFKLISGALDNTGYVIPTRLEKDKTLFDIIGNALDLTLSNTKQIYCLYDDFGKIKLTNIKNMVVPILIDSETGQNYDYATSIDDNVYNTIKLTYEDEEKGVRDVYYKYDEENVKKWGILPLSETIEKDENGKAKADMLLQLYNKKSQSVMIKEAFGDVRVRGGSMVYVKLDLGDVVLDNLMLVEKAKHTFKQGEHYMDLNLKGCDIFAWCKRFSKYNKADS